MHTGLVLAGGAGVWGHRTGGQKLQGKVTLSWQASWVSKGEAEREQRYKDGAM